MLKFAKLALIAGAIAISGSTSAFAVNCDLFGNLKSYDTGNAITVEITNNTDSYRAVLWFDFDGHPIDYRGLNAGESYKQETFARHAWMFTDGPGNCKQISIPKANTTIIEITD